jgi:hypothetical protein
MTQSNQGAVKIDEIAIDKGDLALDIGQNQDGITASEQLRRMISDAFLHTNLLLLSSGTITWNSSSSEIFVPNNNRIIVRMLIATPSSNGRVIQIRFTGQSGMNIGTNNINTNGSDLKILDNEVLCIEINRNIIESAQEVSGVATINLDVSTSGQRLVKYTLANLPKIISQLSGTQNTSLIPLALQTNNILQWIPNGISWSGDNTALLGGFVSGGGTYPVGTIMPFFFCDQANPTVPTGWQRCNGEIITNTQSPLFGKRVPNLNGKAYADNVQRNQFSIAGSISGNTITVLRSAAEYVFVGQEISCPDVGYVSKVSNFSYAGNNIVITATNGYSGPLVNGTINFYMKSFVRCAKKASRSDQSYTSIYPYSERPKPSVALEIRNIPAHQHPVSGPSVTDHSHANQNFGLIRVTPSGHWVALDTGDSGIEPDLVGTNTIFKHVLKSPHQPQSYPNPATNQFNPPAGDHTHMVGTVGNGQAHENRPPFINCIWMMKIF